MTSEARPATKAEPVHGRIMKRVWALCVAAIVAVATLGAVMVTGSGSGHVDSHRPTDRQVERRVARLLTGIPQSGDTLGSATAPITLEIFGDLECLTTRNWFGRLLPAIIGDFVRRGIVKLRYRSLETDTGDPSTFLNQQVAALAAGQQDKLWSFVATFYYEQGKEYTGYVTQRYLENIARQVTGLNLSTWNSERHDVRLGDQVLRDGQVASDIGFNDTPAFLIGREENHLRALTGRHIILEFPGFAKMRYPVSLIDVQDLKTAIRKLAPTMSNSN
jgi:protein-disulfide isomerase